MSLTLEARVQALVNRSVKEMQTVRWSAKAVAERGFEPASLVRLREKFECRFALNLGVIRPTPAGTVRRLTELIVVYQQCQRRRNRAAILDDFIEALIVAIGSMEDTVRFDFCRVKGRFLSSGVGNQTLAKPMSLGGDVG